MTHVRRSDQDGMADTHKNNNTPNKETISQRLTSLSEENQRVREADKREQQRHVKQTHTTANPPDQPVSLSSSTSSSSSSSFSSVSEHVDQTIDSTAGKANSESNTTATKSHVIAATGARIATTKSDTAISIDNAHTETDSHVLASSSTGDATTMPDTAELTGSTHTVTHAPVAAVAAAASVAAALTKATVPARPASTPPPRKSCSHPNTDDLDDRQRRLNGGQAFLDFRRRSSAVPNSAAAADISSMAQCHCPTFKHLKQAFNQAQLELDETRLRNLVLENRVTQLQQRLREAQRYLEPSNSVTGVGGASGGAVSSKSLGQRGYRGSGGGRVAERNSDSGVYDGYLDGSHGDSSGSISRLSQISTLRPTQASIHRKTLNRGSSARLDRTMRTIVSSTGENIIRKRMSDVVGGPKASVGVRLPGRRKSAYSTLSLTRSSVDLQSLLGLAASIDGMSPPLTPSGSSEKPESLGSTSSGAVWSLPSRRHSLSRKESLTKAMPPPKLTQPDQKRPMSSPARAPGAEPVAGVFRQASASVSSDNIKRSSSANMIERRESKSSKSNRSVSSIREESSALKTTMQKAAAAAASFAHNGARSASLDTNNTQDEETFLRNYQLNLISKQVKTRRYSLAQEQRMRQRCASESNTNLNTAQHQRSQSTLSTAPKEGNSPSKSESIAKSADGANSNDSWANQDSGESVDQSDTSGSTNIGAKLKTEKRSHVKQDATSNLLASASSSRSSRSGSDKPASSRSSRSGSDSASHGELSDGSADSAATSLPPEGLAAVACGAVIDPELQGAIRLPRGGVYVFTKSGPVQFGIPPETIKDSMELGLGVPTRFVVPKERFNLRLGINNCEVEFPAYYNFFLAQRSVELICSNDVKDIVKKVVDETLEGPSRSQLYVDKEYPMPAKAAAAAFENDMLRHREVRSSTMDSESAQFQTRPAAVSNAEVPPWDGLDLSTQSGGLPDVRFSYEARPDHVKEIDYFKQPRNGRVISTDTLVSFNCFETVDSSPVLASIGPFSVPEHASVATLGDGLYIVDVDDEYIVIEDGVELTRIPSLLSTWIPSMAPNNPFSVPEKLLEPPDFGITVLGSSHGFDPEGSTSGFVLWIHKKGIMVDPPPNATEIMEAAGIIPSMINGIVLTHCHADHDAGTFQKILKEGRITLITTKTVFDSFVRKYSLISGFTDMFLLKLFEAKIVKIGEPLHWYGGTLRFFYALHALPCVGFEAFVGGKSFVYSSDTYYDPNGLQELQDQGWISEQRKQALMAFPWHYDMILHEAGIAPIHTPTDALNALPDSVKENLYIIHITEAKAKEAGLKLARAGVEHTISIPIDTSTYSESAKLLQILRSTDISRSFTISQASDLLRLCRVRTYETGEYVCHMGDPGEHLYVILSGFCAVIIDDVTKDRGHVENKSDNHLFLGDSAGGVGVSSTCVDSVSTEKEKEEEKGKLLPDEPNTFPEVSLKKIFGTGDYLGELALLEGRSRTAAIRALTKVELIKLDRFAIRYLVDTTPGMLDRMERLSRIRCSLSWQAIEQNSVFCRLGSTQRSNLQAIMRREEVAQDQVLWQAGEPVKHAYLVSHGSLVFEEMRDDLDTPFDEGAFLCDIASMMSRRAVECGQEAEGPTTSKVSLVASARSIVYAVDADDIMEYLDHNPGILINLIDSLVME